MTGFWGEIRYAVRMLLKHPGVSGLAVVALALGIGLTAVMFSQRRHVVLSAYWCPR